MTMPVTLEIVDQCVQPSDFEEIYSYFDYIDQTFSTYKTTSQISLINAGQLNIKNATPDVKKVLKLCANTKQITDGFFNHYHHGQLDPLGLVKGWAIYNAAKLLTKKGYQNFYLDVGGDIQVSGSKSPNAPWRVGIRNPFNTREIIKTVFVKTEGVATSGTYERGQHIYNPKHLDMPITEIVSLTVIGPNIYEADRFITPAFAMGKAGISFIQSLAGFEGYMIDREGMATYTPGFERFTTKQDP